MSNLRERLRSDTRALHEEVDDALSRLDLREEEGLGRFLEVQVMALRAIRCQPGSRATEGEALRDEMLSAVEADLRHLGRGAGSELAAAELHPVAVLYVLLGSGLGAQVLRRRWLMASDPAVQAAGHLFGLPPRTALWRQFCAETAARSAEGREAGEILCDAGRIFGLYRAALDQARPPVLSRIET